MAGLPPKDEGVAEGAEGDGKMEAKDEPETKPILTGKDAAKGGTQGQAQTQAKGGGGKKKKGKR